MENYVRTVRIEAMTMTDMAEKEILPAVMRYCGDLCASLNEKRKTLPEFSGRSELKRIEKLSLLTEEIDSALEALKESIVAKDEADITVQAFHIRDEMLGRMEALRAFCDEAETITAAGYWPFPTYGELLFGV